MRNKLPSVTSNIPRDLRAFIDRLRELVAGQGADRLVSTSDLVTAGLAQLSPTGTVVPPAESYVASSPAPTGVTAVAAIDNVVVSWDSPSYVGHAYAEVWGAATNNLAIAVKLGMSPGSLYIDPLGPSTTRYYWVRFVNIADTAGAFNSTAGTSATTGGAVSYTLGLLAGAITSSQLAYTLNSRIDLIDGSSETIGTIPNQLAQLQGQLNAINTYPDYVGTTTYNSEDIVKYSGGLYKAIATTTGNLPTNETYWLKIGDYSSLADAVAAHTVEIGALTTVYGDTISAGASAAEAAQSVIDALAAQAAASGSASSAATSATTATTSKNAAGVSATAAATSAANALTYSGDAGTYATAASSSATTAASSAGTASTKATEAATSATNASGSASSAATSATTAATSENAAGVSATAAATSETNALTYSGDAGTYATAASSSATNAASSAGTASTKATEAATSATNASGSASSAATSATTATTSENAAGVSATAAATSETNALTYSGAAGTYATAASSSATNAASSAGTASTKATEAATSATTAAGSASSADTSATTATTSKNAAGASATAAATSATNALTYSGTAGTAATSSSTSATNAATSAANAGTKATEAATSATNADGSASAAALAFTNVQATVRGTSLALPLEQWVLNGQSIVTIADGKVGNYALQLGGPGAYPNQGNFIPLNPGKKYRVKFWARPSADTTGVLYFSLRQFTSDSLDSPGPSNGGRAPYKPSAQSRAAHIALYGDTWGEYSYEWSTSDWQAGVKYFQPEFLDNYSNAVGNWQIQGLTIVDGTDLSASIVNLEQTKIGYATLNSTPTVPFDNNGAIVDSASVTVWNTANPTNQATWRVGLPLATAVKQVSVTDASGNTAAISQAFTTQKTLNDEFKAQYSIRVDVNGKVSGYGLYGTSTTSEFITNVDKFAVTTPTTSIPLRANSTAYALNAIARISGNDTKTLVCKVAGNSGGSAPSIAGAIGSMVSDGEVKWQIASRVPFSVLSAPTVINGQTVAAGVYLDAAYVLNATIQNAQIAALAVDDSKLVDVNVGKLTAGSLQTDSYIQSSNYAPDTANGPGSGFRISANGDANFQNAFLRGAVYASSGSFTGAVYASSGTFTGAVYASSGTFTGTINASSGNFAGSLVGASIDGTTGTFTGVLSATTFKNALTTGETFVRASPGSYAITCPTGKLYTRMRVYMIGGGGGGGGGSATYNEGSAAGGGGGGGGVYSATFTITEGGTYTVTVGGAGTGAPSYAGNRLTSPSGTAGGTSSIVGPGLSISATGGGGGGGASYGTFGGGGAGGLGTNTGGAGAVGVFVYTAMYYDSGDSGVGPFYDYYGGKGGSAPLGNGVGGSRGVTAYRNFSILNGGNGGVYGGGGGGGAGNTNQAYVGGGGNGAAGKVIIEFFNPDGIVQREEFNALINTLAQNNITFTYP